MLSSSAFAYTVYESPNHGFMEGGPPMEAWKFTHTASFIVVDTTYSGTSQTIFVQSSITPGTHTYLVPLTASHAYTIYVQPSGPIAYAYHFTLD